ncbi:MAG: hypothetical protein V3G42_14135 [Oscillospiraceae bacterium]
MSNLNVQFDSFEEMMELYVFLNKHILSNEDDEVNADAESIAMQKIQNKVWDAFDEYVISILLTAEEVQELYKLLNSPIEKSMIANAKSLDKHTVNMLKMQERFGSLFEKYVLQINDSKPVNETYREQADRTENTIWQKG